MTNNSDPVVGGLPLLGAFARIFQRSTADGLGAAFEQHGLTEVQLNLSALGLPTIPADDALRGVAWPEIQTSFRSHGAHIWGVSATYNTAHPELARRREDTLAAARFIARLAPSGAIAATLCSGSRDPVNMWGRHPDTSTESAWRDFRESLDLLIPAAEASGVLLAIEPEPANTVSDVSRAIRLLRELGPDADRIAFILDPANLVSDQPREQHERTLRRAFDVLADRTICVHAKDTVPWDRTIAGDGVVDYDLVGELYRFLPRRVPLIIQDAEESELDRVIAIVRNGTLARADA